MKGYCFLTLKLMCLKRTVSPTDSSATTATPPQSQLLPLPLRAPAAAAGSGGIAQTAMTASRAAYRGGWGRGAPWMKLLTAPGGL